MIIARKWIVAALLVGAAIGLLTAQYAWVVK